MIFSGPNLRQSLRRYWASDQREPNSTSYVTDARTAALSPSPTAPGRCRSSSAFTLVRGAFSWEFYNIQLYAVKAATEETCHRRSNAPKLHPCWSNQRPIAGATIVTAPTALHSIPNRPRSVCGRLLNRVAILTTDDPLAMREFRLSSVVDPSTLLVPALRKTYPPLVRTGLG
jgi:hypothetical protein